MPLFDYKCECGVEKERLTKYDEKVFCSICKKEMKRQLPINTGVCMGVGAYGYYDDNLQAYINTNADKKRIMQEQGVAESYGKGWM